jgi:flavin-dependent dehydrogenase
VIEIFDIAVVAAGPAGSVAAYAAATRGLRVALIDRQAFPRDKPCGDDIGPRLSILHKSLGWTTFLAATSRSIRKGNRSRRISIAWYYSIDCRCGNSRLCRAADLLRQAAFRSGC